MAEVTIGDVFEEVQKCRDDIEALEEKLLARVRVAQKVPPKGATPAKSAATPPGGGERLRGKFKWFNSRMGYGYLTLPDGSGEAFVHKTSLSAALRAAANDGDGERLLDLIDAESPVTFSVSRNPKGLQALDVQECQ